MIDIKIIYWMICLTGCANILFIGFVAAIMTAKIDRVWNFLIQKSEIKKNEDVLLR